MEEDSPRETRRVTRSGKIPSSAKTSSRGSLDSAGSTQNETFTRRRTRSSGENLQTQTASPQLRSLSNTPKSNAVEGHKSEKRKRTSTSDNVITAKRRSVEQKTATEMTDLKTQSHRRKRESEVSSTDEKASGDETRSLRHRVKKRRKSEDLHNQSRDCCGGGEPAQTVDEEDKDHQKEPCNSGNSPSRRTDLLNETFDKVSDCAGAHAHESHKMLDGGVLDNDGDTSRSAVLKTEKQTSAGDTSQSTEPVDTNILVTNGNDDNKQKHSESVEENVDGDGSDKRHNHDNKRNGNEDDSGDDRIGKQADDREETPESETKDAPPAGKVETSGIVQDLKQDLESKERSTGELEEPKPINSIRKEILEESKNRESRVEGESKGTSSPTDDKKQEQGETEENPGSTDYSNEDQRFKNVTSGETPSGRSRSKRVDSLDFTETEGSTDEIAPVTPKSGNRKRRSSGSATSTEKDGSHRRRSAEVKVVITGTPGSAQRKTTSKKTTPTSAKTGKAKSPKEQMLVVKKKSPGTRRKSKRRSSFVRGRISRAMPPSSVMAISQDIPADVSPEDRLQQITMRALDYTLEKMSGEFPELDGFDQFRILAREAVEESVTKLKADGVLKEATNKSLCRPNPANTKLEETITHVTQYTAKLKTESEKWDEILENSKKQTEEAERLASSVCEHPIQDPPETLSVAQKAILQGRPDYRALLHDLKKMQERACMAVDQIAAGSRALDRFQQTASTIITERYNTLHAATFKNEQNTSPRKLIQESLL